MNQILSSEDDNNSKLSKIADQPNLFWIDDELWSVITPNFPEEIRHRPEQRRIVSGIIHVYKSKCRWNDVPKEYGLPSTVYSCFRRWRHRPFWTRMIILVAHAGWPNEAHALDPKAFVKFRPSRHGKKIDRAWRLETRSGPAKQPSIKKLE